MHHNTQSVPSVNRQRRFFSYSQFWKSAIGIPVNSPTRHPCSRICSSRQALPTVLTRLLGGSRLRQSGSGDSRRDRLRESRPHLRRLDWTGACACASPSVRVDMSLCQRSLSRVTTGCYQAPEAFTLWNDGSLFVSVGNSSVEGSRYRSPDAIDSMSGASQAARRRPSIRWSHMLSWFQLVKIRVTTFHQHSRTAPCS